MILSNSEKAFEITSCIARTYIYRKINTNTTIAMNDRRDSMNYYIIVETFSILQPGAATRRLGASNVGPHH